MSEVIIPIGGKGYAVACGDGEEEHVRALGETVSAKLEGMGDNLAPQEAQNLVFAGLLVADELHELRSKFADLETRHAAVLEEVGTARREANMNVGLSDELKNKLNDRERELENLQSALQSSAKDADEVRADLTKLREQQDGWSHTEMQLRGELAETQKENEKLQNLMEGLQNTLDQMKAQKNASQQSPPPIAVSEAELAPALERFADLLENCADKLEGRLPSS